MNDDTALTFSWLNILSKKRYQYLLSLFGTLDEALVHLNEELLSKLFSRNDTVQTVLHRLRSFDVEAYKKTLEQRDIHFLSIEDQCYPSLLKHIPDPPLFLYFQGCIDILDQPCIAGVGTRSMSGYGMRVVEHFVPAFVEAGLTTVSGLALGIDTEVALRTLETNGRTVACLGHGLRMIYPPSNRRLSERIVDKGGLLLTEFPFDHVPGKYTFPARNRIIAGMSLGTIVFEGREKSGALITAELALDYGRDVFAVPGQIFNRNAAGCHQLLADNQAKLVTHPEDVLCEITTARKHILHPAQELCCLTR